MAYYLSMDGVDDWLKLPASMSANTFVLDVEINSMFADGYKSILDCRAAGVTGSYYNVKEIGSGFTGYKINGTNASRTINDTTLPKNTRITIELTTSTSTSGTEIRVFGRGIVNEYTIGKIHTITCKNSGGTTVALYDMSTQTVQDQSGNGYHGTLVGGTWIDGGGGGGTNATVNAVTANTTASSVTPTFTAQKQVSVSSVVANATATTGIPSVSVSATISGVVASATAQALIPQVGSFTNINVTAVIANVTANDNAPSVEAIRNIGIGATIANVTAEAMAPFVGSSQSVQMTAVIAALTAGGIVPILSTTQGIRIDSLAAGVSAQAISPTIMTDSVISAVVAGLQAAGVATTVTLNAMVIIGTIELKGQRVLNVYLQGNRELNVLLKGGIDMTAVNQNFSMIAGDTKSLIATMSEDLTGASVKWVIKKDVNSTENILLKTSTISGTDITIKLDPADTLSLSGVYYHECEVTDQQNNISTVFTGKCSINKSGI